MAIDSTARKKDLYPGFTSVSGTSPQVQRLETGAQRIQRGTIRPTSGTYARIPKSLISNPTGTKQFVNLSDSIVRKIGSVSPQTATNGFGYTSDGSSITIYWDGTNGSKVIQIHRADQSVFNLPVAGSGIQVTGLSNGVTYYFLPFFSTTGNAVGWVKGTIGSPQIAFVVGDTTDPVNGPIYIIRQSSQANEPLSAGFMPIPCGTGGSGNPDNGGCVMQGTQITPVGDIPMELKFLPEQEWVYLKLDDGRELKCTYDHPLYSETGKTQASMLIAGEPLLTDTGLRKIVESSFFTQSATKVKVSMPEGHLFFANGFLSHNIKFRTP